MTWPGAPPVDGQMVTRQTGTLDLFSGEHCVCFIVVAPESWQAGVGHSGPALEDAIEE